MSYFSELFHKMINWFSLSTFHVSDALEILFLAWVIYNILIWIKATKAWTLLRGIVIIFVFILLATILKLDTILWLAQKLASIVAIAAVIVFQPEIRRALERLGEKKFLATLLGIGENGDHKLAIAREAISCISAACEQMSRDKTGALIVMERSNSLADYEKTGIPMDAMMSSQLLVNIFEHNTPLHDGAVIVRDSRIVAATCYLPLSTNLELDKELGTRHRAAVGISEVTDAFVIIVSEETGAISVASGGKITRGLSGDDISTLLENMQELPKTERKFRFRMGKEQHEQ